MSVRIHDTSAIPGGFLVHHSVCWCRKGGDRLGSALEAFRTALTEEDSVRELAPGMAAGEAEAIAGLLDALDENSAAALWRELADNDEEAGR
ncbi:hypothetical protein [Amycolatopsis sp. VC5-11]|uniref:hypothetical protein n=1 Tax=Amycolatopsis sp. VC5-11 TaxID=3120156 RepID=UPI00300B878B